MGDADSVDQWNQSTTGQYSDFEWDGTSFNDPMSNSRLQPSRVMGHLGENPGVISNWPQPSDHLDYEYAAPVPPTLSIEVSEKMFRSTARLVGLCAFDQAQQKTRECWPSGSQRLGNESCVSDFTPSLSSVEQSFDADRYQFEMGQGCLEAVTSLDDIESLQQNLMHVTGAHQSESLAPPKLIQDVSQGSSNLWGLNLSTTEFCTPSSTHHTPEFEVPNSRPKEHERTQVISITARESFFDPLSAATENINQDIQSLGLNSPCSLGFSRTSDTSDIQQDPDLSASNLESPNMPIHPLHGLPNNESRLKFGSASSSLSNDSVRQTDQRVPQVPRGWVIEETNGLKPSPHSGIRESFIDPAQQRASIIRPCISETNGKQTDGNNTRKAPRPRNTFQIVREDGGGGPTSGLPQATPTCRARRQGPLSADGRRNAALRRKDRSVCIWCRLSKKKSKPSPLLSSSLA
ncbi:hypothetical protein PRK78_004351 [Emydomyces testavorans]|uniref:Uncharacterized protein n=1 Tax=Emydomyces testavorans TaxID=2070801 RepID=A0AAF0DIN4_9EURO|nr:hypothetical protein PRK78_004351 [Emydomyces testavorans]